VKYRISTAATAERREATRFYEQRSPAAATRFNEELRRTLDRLAKYPEIGSRVDGAIRHAPLHAFPFTIVYTVGDDTLEVVAVAHDSRDPNYWRDRVR
jgi:plasmid stabilization system protein ParE